MVRAAKSPVDPESGSALSPVPERVTAARRTLLEGVGKEVAESFPGITRLGGQIVAALYLADVTLSMEALSRELGCSKSNIFTNLRALEAAGIVQRSREPGTRHDGFSLRGRYPDVIIGAYFGRLRRVVVDKVDLSKRALALLGDERGEGADELRQKLESLLQKYEGFADLYTLLMPSTDGPFDLERLVAEVPPPVLAELGAAVRRALGPKKT
jgi:DNA-binding transcriptional regulator GbsR (MarR family)